MVNIRNGESLTTRADKFDFLRATGRLAFEPNLVESVGSDSRQSRRIPNDMTCRHLYGPVITPCIKKVFKIESVPYARMLHPGDSQCDHQI